MIFLGRPYTLGSVTQATVAPLGGGAYLRRRLAWWAAALLVWFVVR